MNERALATAGSTDADCPPIPKVDESKSDAASVQYSAYRTGLSTAGRASPSIAAIVSMVFQVGPFG